MSLTGCWWAAIGSEFIKLNAESYVDGLFSVMKIRNWKVEQQTNLPKLSHAFYDVSQDDIMQ